MNSTRLVYGAKSRNQAQKAENLLKFIVFGMRLGER